MAHCSASRVLQNGPAAPEARTERQRPASLEQMSSLRTSASAAILALKLRRRRRCCSAAEHRFSRAIRQNNRLRYPTSSPACLSCAAIDHHLHAPACPATTNLKRAVCREVHRFQRADASCRRGTAPHRTAARVQRSRRHYRKLVWRLRLFLRGKGGYFSAAAVRCQSHVKRRSTPKRIAANVVLPKNLFKRSSRRQLAQVGCSAALKSRSALDRAQQPLGTSLSAHLSFTDPSCRI